MNEKILIIEDDPTIIEGLVIAFEFHGYELLTAQNGIEGLAHFRDGRPALVIIDIMLPDIDGYDICKKIRESDDSIPLIFLTAKNQESDKLLGFELGADDYVTKPFSAKELIARVKVHLKKRDKTVQQNRAELPVIGSVQIDFDNFVLIRNDERIPLSPKEQKILKLLHENPDRVVSRDEIIDGVWGEEYDPNIKTIDNFIGKLRKKIEADPKKPKYLLNVFGAGFKLSLKGEEPA